MKLDYRIDMNALPPTFRAIFELGVLLPSVKKPIMQRKFIYENGAFIPLTEHVWRDGGDWLETFFLRFRHEYIRHERIILRHSGEVIGHIDFENFVDTPGGIVLLKNLIENYNRGGFDPMASEFRKLTSNDKELSKNG